MAYTKMAALVLLHYCLLGMCFHTVFSNTMEDVKTLMSDLMENYPNKIRPVKNQSESVKISVGLSILSIKDFNEASGIISLVTSLSIYWNDEYLQWKSRDYNGIKLIQISDSDIWLPRMKIDYLADEYKPLGEQHSILTVKPSGSVYWNQGGLLHVLCNTDVTYFPFDHQKCVIRFTASGYESSQVSVLTSSFYSSDTLLFSGGEWETTSIDSFIGCVFTIKMHRVPVMFIMSVMLPIFFLALINPFIFLLPFTCGERTSCFLTVLLALTLYMTVANERLPQTSYSVFTAFLFYLLISNVLTLVNIYHIRYFSYQQDTATLPWWLRRWITPGLTSEAAARFADKVVFHLFVWINMGACLLFSCIIYFVNFKPNWSF